MASIQHVSASDQALLTLADGHIGTSGASLVPNPAQHPWVVATGVYDGDGADTHLLTGPRIFELAGTADGAPRRRLLDLRAGVLYEQTSCGGETINSVRFASLAEPGTLALRARCPKGLPSGPPLMPPTADPVGDQGRVGADKLDPGGRVPRWDCGGRLTDPAVAGHTRSVGRVPGRSRSVPEPGPAVDALDTARSAGFDGLLQRAPSRLGPAMGGG